MRRTLALLLSVLFLLSLPVYGAFAAGGDNDAAFTPPTENDAAEDGIRFTHMGTYTLEDTYSTIPRTLEAEILFPKGFDETGGVLLSNETAGSSSAFMTFAVDDDGIPRLKYKGSDRVLHTFLFDSVDVRTGQWLHLSFVMDESAKEARCYIDGVLKQTLTKASNGADFTECHRDGAVNAFHVGGDATSQNPNYFRGGVRSLAVFGKARTHAEILSDFKDGVVSKERSLLTLFDLKDAKMGDELVDLSSRKNNASAVIEWCDASVGAYSGEFDFSLAVIGDTQTITNSHPRNLKTIYQWILDNKDAKKTQYASGLGDITETGEDETHRNYNLEVATKQWTAAKEAITMMDGKLPYSLTRGSGHDGVNFFNQYFADHEGYTQNITGYYEEGRIENVYHVFEVDGVKYMILCLDFGAKDPILEWANSLVEAHPDHYVIVTTHAYLEKDGSTLDTGEEYCPSQSYYDPENNDGNDLWDKFVSKHKSIFLVLSGHMSADGVVINQRDGKEGNTVTEMLIDPQSIDRNYTGGTGMVATLYFSGERVAVEYYSTVQDMYRPLQYFEINHKHAYTESIVPPACGKTGYTLHECSCGDSYQTDPVSSLHHQYDDAWDEECNLCGEIREVKEKPVEETSEIAPSTDSEPGESEETAPGDGTEESDGENGDGDMTVWVAVIVSASVVGVGAIGGGVWLFLKKRR